eukprot:7153374-Ditylum_brightwellii.AAC.1
MILENKPLVDNKTLKSLIKNKTAHQTKALLKEIKDCKQKLTPSTQKNSAQRCQRSSSPKHKQRNTTKERRQGARKQNTGEQAKEFANDGTD